MLLHKSKAFYTLLYVLHVCAGILALKSEEIFFSYEETCSFCITVIRRRLCSDVDSVCERRASASSGFWFSGALSLHDPRSV